MISRDIYIGYSTEYIEINDINIDDINIAFMKSYSGVDGIHIMVPMDGGAHLISFDDNNEFALNRNITRNYIFDLGLKDQLKIIGVDIV